MFWEAWVGWSRLSTTTLWTNFVTKKNLKSWNFKEHSSGFDVCHCIPVSLREFELLMKNGSWMDAVECKEIPLTHCDLTFDLGSDSNYNLQVRAHCGAQLSAWTKLDSPFNRRDSKAAGSFYRPDWSIKFSFTADVWIFALRKPNDKSTHLVHQSSFVFWLFGCGSGSLFQQLTKSFIIFSGPDEAWDDSDHGRRYPPGVVW